MEQMDSREAQAIEPKKMERSVLSRSTFSPTMSNQALVDDLPLARADKRLSEASHLPFQQPPLSVSSSASTEEAVATDHSVVPSQSPTTPLPWSSSVEGLAETSSSSASGAGPSQSTVKSQATPLQMSSLSSEAVLAETSPLSKSAFGEAETIVTSVPLPMSSKPMTSSAGDVVETSLPSSTSPATHESSMVATRLPLLPPLLPSSLSSPSDVTTEETSRDPLQQRLPLLASSSSSSSKEKIKTSHQLQPQLLRAQENETMSPAQPPPQSPSALRESPVPSHPSSPSHQSSGDSVQRFVFGICKGSSFKNRRKKNANPKRDPTYSLLEAEDEMDNFLQSEEEKSVINDESNVGQGICQQDSLDDGTMKDSQENYKKMLQEYYVEISQNGETDSTSHTIPQNLPDNFPMMSMIPPNANSQLSKGTVGSSSQGDNDKPRPFTCEFCDRRFTRLQALNNHRMIHTDEKPFACDTCGQTFRQKQNLTTHIRTHTGEKPHVCNECGKTFRQPSTLARHLRCHTGARPYFCEFCGQTFSQLHAKKIHVRIHTGELPFKCTLCSKGFKEKHNLARHLRWHAGEKPYTCDVCGNKFSQKCHLQLHEKTHIPKKHTI